MGCEWWCGVWFSFSGMPAVGRIPSSVTVHEQTASVSGFGRWVGLGKDVGRGEPFPSLEEVTAHPSVTFRRGGEQWGVWGQAAAS